MRQEGRRAAAGFVLAMIVAGGCGGAEGGGSAQIDLSQRQTVPSKVPARLDEIEEPTPPYCSRDVARPAVELQALDPAATEFTTPDQPVSVGHDLAICTRGFDASLPLMLTVERGGRAVLRRRLPAGGADRLSPWHVLVGPRLVPGAYAVAARQKGVVASASFAVKRQVPAARGVWTSARFGVDAGVPVDVVASGQPPRSTVNLDVYAFAGPEYRYLTTATAVSDDGGMVSAVVRTRAADANDYLVRVRSQSAQIATLSLIGRNAGTPVALAPGERPHSVFQARDKPPPGVSQFADYYAGGGDNPCPTSKSSRPAIVFGDERLDPSEPGDPRHLHAGDTVSVCIAQFRKGTPITLTIAPPAGRRYVEGLGADADSYHSVFERLIGASAALGTYAVTVKQGSRTAKGSFEVARPVRPDLRTFTAPDGNPAVLAVGLAPGQTGRALLYREPTGFAGKGRVTVRVAGFVGSIPIHSDSRGIAVATFPTAPDDPPDCYVVTVAFGERVLAAIQSTRTLIYRGSDDAPDPQL